MKFICGNVYTERQIIVDYGEDWFGPCCSLYTQDEGRSVKFHLSLDEVDAFICTLGDVRAQIIAKLPKPELTPEERRSKDETDLISEFEMEHGEPGNWPPETEKLFDKLHDVIMRRDYTKEEAFARRS